MSHVKICHICSIFLVFVLSLESKHCDHFGLTMSMDPMAGYEKAMKAGEWYLEERQRVFGESSGIKDCHLDFRHF